MKHIAIRATILYNSRTQQQRRLLNILPHQDPADRFIAATAVYHQIPLATVDANLTAASWLLTIS